MQFKILLTIVIILAVLGIADASYALHQHYAPTATSSCDVNETISCTAINQSEYSILLGVPVAGIGVAGYVLIAGMAMAMILRFHPQMVGWMLLATAMVALAFSLWLTWIEVFILEAVCPLCVLSLLLITAITVLSLLIVLIVRRKAVNT